LKGKKKREGPKREIEKRGGPPGDYEKAGRTEEVKGKKS